MMKMIKMNENGIYGYIVSYSTYVRSMEEEEKEFEMQKILKSMPKMIIIWESE